MKPSKLSKFKIDFEYDKTLRRIKYETRRRHDRTR